MKLILDFDDTIFNTTEFKKYIFRVLEDHGVPEASSLYERSKNQGELFSLPVFLKNVGKSGLYLEIMSCCTKFVYAPMVAILELAGKDNCSIVTHGDSLFQKDKIARSGVGGMVKEVIVVSGSKKDIVESFAKNYPLEKIIFVDDKIDFLLDIDTCQYPNLHVIHFSKEKIKILEDEIFAG